MQAEQGVDPAEEFAEEEGVPGEEERTEDTFLRGAEGAQEQGADFGQPQFG